jgi:hypothetical protein
VRRVDALHDEEGAVGEHDGFKVDPEGVREFGAALRGQLDGHLAPESERIAQSFVAAPPIGARSASPDVQQAVKVYHHQLIRLLDLMDTFLHNGAVMAQAAEDVARAYDTTDSLSGQEFTRVLDGAAVQVNAAATAAANAAHIANIDPRTGRLL